MKVRWVISLSLTAFAVALAVVVGERLTSEAMAVIVGVIAGVAASIPTSLIVVWVATRNMPERQAPVEARRDPGVGPAPEPRVVVVTAPQPAPQPTPNPYQLPYPAALAPPIGGPRQFTVIGGTSLDESEAEDLWPR